jgi:hypothetical protein
MWRLIILASIFFAGCTIPAEIFFRNFSNKKVRLQASLVHRQWFYKIPNQVNFYDTSSKKHKFYGQWRANALVTWVDSSRFYIDIPAFTVINIADISNGLTLGAKQPDIILTMASENKTDTLTTGDYLSIVENFKSTGYGLLKPPVYYYDYY